MEIGINSHFVSPQNCARYHETSRKARIWESGKIELGYTLENFYIKNLNFEKVKIQYDNKYFTTQCFDDGKVPQTSIYIDNVLNHLDSLNTIFDIGCGQGEFVTYLRNRGLVAFGVDPTFRSDNIYCDKLYFDSLKHKADLYVMRCVLPHIPNPWDFLVDIMNCNPDSYFLVEFQNLDWIIENKLWWGISYDHVNLFTIQDFKNRFKVEMSGVFGKGEWNWVLFKSQKMNLKVPVLDLRLVDKLELLSQYRIETLVKLKEYLNGSRKKFLIWGAAGKGAILGLSLKNLKKDLPIKATDLDPAKWNTHLETSGIKIVSPQSLLISQNRYDVVLIANPLHFEYVKDFLNQNEKIFVLNELIK